MQRFTDNDRRDWQVEINVSTVKRLRAFLDLDLMQALGGNVLERLASDPILLVDAIYVACKPQADERKVSDEDFGRAMAGECLEKAADAFFKELLDFFQPRQRELLAKILAKVQESQARAAASAIQAVDRPEVDQAVDRLIAEGEREMLSRLNALGRSSTSASEYSA